MLQALGQDVIRPLIWHDRIHEMQIADGPGLVLLQNTRCLPKLHPERSLFMRGHGSLSCSPGHHVRVRGRAQEGDGRVLALRAEPLHDAVAGHSDLHVEGPIQVGVIADRQALAWRHRAHPSRDLRGLRQQVATADLGKRVEVLLCHHTLPIHALLNWEDELPRALLSLVQDASERPGPRHGHDSGTEAEQERQWSHRGGGSEQHEVHVGQIQPIPLLHLQCLQRISNVGLQGAVLDPLVQLLAQLGATDLVLALLLKLVVRLPQHRRTVAEGQFGLAVHALLAFQLCNVEDVLAEFLHGVLHRHLRMTLAEEPE
mmetsp:Transcript_57692/g.146457  ORF Transcript_57692/g.146457 Transcript_57692/m.146457 type:complete len:315 (-) Transcript_57692:958-1902(-)